MADWLSSMQQTFEYYIVDPGTWEDAKQLTTVKSCTIDRDLTVETLGSATFDITEPIGECYVRVYLITIQNGVRERFPLGTFLVQTPAYSFNGKIRSFSADAYTPLLELKEKQPPLGYAVSKGENIMEYACRMVRDNVRAPVVTTSNSKTLERHFVAETDETMLTYAINLMANAKYELALDELGQILFAPKQELAALQPIWTYDDSNSSILYPDISQGLDLYGIPNVVEVIYSTGKTMSKAVVKNEDPDSPVSTVVRGREIKKRVTDTGFIGELNQNQIGNVNDIEIYAKELLESLSTVEQTVSYTHAYCGTRLGDCIRVNYERAGLTDIKAKIISQSIKCVPGCPVSEKAAYINKLWGDAL